VEVKAHVVSFEKHKKENHLGDQDGRIRSKLSRSSSSIFNLVNMRKKIAPEFAVCVKRYEF